VVDAGPNRVVLEGGSTTLTPTVTGNDLTYLWTPSTYLSNTTSATPVASNMADDITYRITVTSRGGCTASDTIFIKILRKPGIPNTFSPNGDGINEYWIIEYLDTYPENRVQIFTRTGALVFESHGYKTPWNGTMNGKSLPIDTYYYIIEPGSGRKPITGYVTILK
jgi:gliding motility-associated-like protein